MAYEFSESDLKRINSLPAWIQVLKDKYPVSVCNAADTWNESPLPSGYIPEAIEVFYGDDVNSPDLFTRNGKIHSFNLSKPSDTSVIQLLIDGIWAYIQVEGRVVFDRLGGAVLPDIVIDPIILAKWFLQPNLQNN
jgi:hypothetical protein